MSIGKDDATEIGKAVLAALGNTGDEGGDGDTEDQIAMFLAVYDMTVEDFRPFIQAAPQFAALIGQDAAPIFTALLTLANEVMDDDDLQDASEKARILKAERRFAAFAAYKAAGFSDEQAMMILLKDIEKRPSNMLNPASFSQSSSDSKGS